MSDQDDNNLQEFLQTTQYTIPVELSRQDSSGKMLKRRISMTYEFNDEIADKVKNGITEDVDDPENPGLKKQQRRSLSVNEQLCMIVKDVNGIATTPTEDFWAKTFFRFRQQMLEAVMRDVYPNAKASGA